MTKKKIKDLTLKECKSICEKNHLCRYCPIHKVCDESTCFFEEEDLEEEIEVEDDE